MQLPDYKPFAEAGMPEAVAKAVAEAIAGQWISRNRLPDCRKLIDAGCPPLLAEDLVAEIMIGNVIPAGIAAQTGWPAAVGDAINQAMHPLVAQYSRDISALSRGK